LTLNHGSKYKSPKHSKCIMTDNNSNHTLCMRRKKNLWTCNFRDHKTRRVHKNEDNRRETPYDKHKKCTNARSVSRTRNKKRI